MKEKWKEIQSNVRREEWKETIERGGIMRVDDIRKEGIIDRERTQRKWKSNEERYEIRDEIKIKIQKRNERERWKCDEWQKKKNIEWI